MNEAAIPPSIEERLTAAAFEILTDDRRHARDAKVWALRFMDRAARGRSTAFQRALNRQSREVLQ